jgi:hypothetical protein
MARMTDRLPLYALAAHAAGDWPLQTNRMAREKFDDPTVRAKHVGVYTLTFLPVAMASNWDSRGKFVFLLSLAGSHFAIDTRRWAENYDSFPTRALWFDQAFHIIALAIAFALADRTGGGMDA